MAMHWNYLSSRKRRTHSRWDLFHRANPIAGKAQADILWKDDNALMKRYQVNHDVKRGLAAFFNWGVRGHLFDAIFCILSLLLGSMAFSLGLSVPQEANTDFTVLLEAGTTLRWMYSSSAEDCLYKYVHRQSQAGVTVFTQTSHLWLWTGVLSFPSSTTELPYARKEKLR